MNLKPKTVRRLLLLSLVGVFLIGSVFSLFVVRRWQNQRLLASHRSEGLAAFAVGDHFTALDKTAFYFRRGRADDPEVLYALAESRRKLEEPDGRHLVLSIRPYQLYLEHRPDDEETRRTLLKTYNQAGYFIEARDLAASMRPEMLDTTGPEHLSVLREEAFALAGARAHGERLDAVLARIFELDPLDVDAHLLKLDVISQSDRRDKARAWGRGVLEAHGEDARARVVYAASLMIHPTADDIGEARLALCEAAGLDAQTAAVIREVDYGDARAVRRLVALLDGVRAFEHSYRVLRQAAGGVDDVELRRMLVRRTWQEGDDEQIAVLTADLETAARESDSELLGLRAHALLRTGRAGEAAPIVEALREREGDFRAQGWAEVLPLWDPGSTIPPLEAVTALREAIRINPHEPIFRAYLGDQFAALGRLEEARRSWDEAGRHPLGASWALPWVKLAESLLPDGRADEAVTAADEALSIAPNRVMVNMVWFEAQSARILKGSMVGPEPSAVLERLERAMGQVENLPDSEVAEQLRERLLPCKVILLSRLGRTQEARQVVDSIFAGDRQPGAAMLQRLAAVSVSERLGFEDDAIRRAGTLEGGGAGVSHARAAQLAGEGRVEEGLALLREAAGTSPSVDSQMVIARYMDATGHEGALSLWKQLGDQHPKDLRIQYACLTAQAAAADRAFVDRTIARYQKLQGKDSESEDAVVRIARARALLHGRPTKRSRDEAVGILASVVTTQPRLAEPRVLLASALAMSDVEGGLQPDLPRATVQLAEAARLEPRNARVALELARLLQLQRDHPRAREHLLRIAGDDRVDTESRRRAAEMLLAGGDAPRAREVLVQLARAAGDRPSGGLLVSLAESLRASGRPDQAVTVYERLVDGGADDAESVLAAALFLARRDEMARAREMLGRLEELPIQDWERTTAIARFEAIAGSTDSAARQFERAIEQAPRRVGVWRQFAGMYMQSGEWEAAAHVASRGLEASPGDAGLRVVLEQAKLLAAGEEASSLRPLIEALRMDATFSEPEGILRAIEAANQQGQLASVEGLQRLASQYPGSPGLQMYVARRLAPLDAGAAAGLALRAMNIDGRDPEPAKLAAELFLALGRWNDMLSAATAWRSRDRSGSPEPDLAIAEAQFRLGRPDRGVQTLSPHMARAAATPGETLSLSILNLQATMLVASGREAAARALLTPLLPSSASVRVAVWIGIAVRELRSLEQSLAWLEEVQAHIPPDATDEQLAATIALSMLADRHPVQSSELLSQAGSRLEQMVESRGLETAGAWETLGVVRHRTGDIEGAEKAYMQAIDLDGQRAVSLNNLANISAQMRGDLDEALRYAERAVQAGSSPDPAHVATLAAIHREIGIRWQRSGDEAGGRTSFESSARFYGRLSELKPSDPAPVMQRAQSLWLADDARGAAAQYERVLAMPGVTRDVEAVVRNNLATALRVSATGPAELNRAHEVILEAIAISPRAAFYDTLGWVEIKRNRHGDASEAFRRALERSEREGQAMPSSKLGLAYTLREGNREDREEARRLLADVGDVGNEFQNQLNEVRSALQVEGR
jgi:tetratricopeptide (TPR) repeat protein